MAEKNNTQIEKKTLKRALNEEVKEWASSTSFHGFPSMARSENVLLTIIWVICFCGSAGYCTYSIYTSFVGFFQFNVVTQIQEVYENPVPFPTLTLCNLNPFVTNEGQQYAHDVLIENGIDDVVTSEYLAKNFTSKLQAGMNIYITKNLVVSNAKNEPANVTKTFGMNLNQSIAMCFYNLNTCNFTLFNWYYSYNYGNCYQFNAPSNMNNDPNDITYTYKTGLKYGFGILVFTGLPNNVNSLTLGRGGHLFIHNQSSGPESTSGLDIAPGLFTNIVISRVFSQQLPNPYNDCYEDLTTPDKFDSFFYRETLKSGYTYRQVDCLNLNQQDANIKGCGCSDPEFPSLYGTPYCTTINQISCLFSVYYSVYALGANKDWLQYCPLECSTEQFTFSVSSSAFPSKSFAEILLNISYVRENLDYIGEPYTMESIRENYAYVNIYYDYTGYTLISESPAQLLVDLLSSIGGTMGLYIGISFLSFVEVFELLFQVTITTCKFIFAAKKKTNRITVMSKKP